MTRELERRHVHVPVEWRAAKNGDASPLGVLTGYAAVFNRTSQNLGGFVEEVDPAAFNKSIGDGLRIIARTHHDNAWLLGTTEAETLRLFVDGTGLGYEVDLPDTQAGRDTQALAKRGDLRYSSFAFRCIEDAWSETPDGFLCRRLLAVQLVDVAPVIEPAYLDSTTGMRSLAGRLGLDVDDVAARPVDELRALLAGETPANEDAPADAPVEGRTAMQDEPVQRETHAVDVRRLMVDLLAIR